MAHNWFDQLVGWAERQQAGDAISAELYDYPGTPFDEPPPNRNTVRRKIYQRNPVRYKRLMREYRWMQKQMVKMGLNPEDARWLL